MAAGDKATKKEYAKNQRKATQPDTRGVFHFFSILLVLIGFACVNTALWATLASLGERNHLSVGHAPSVPWLLVVNQTSSSTADLKPSGQAAAKDFTLKAWGFGPFGWCSWTHDPAHLQDEAECYGPAWWSITGSELAGSPIAALDLPGVITNGLSGVSVFFLTMAVLSYGAWLIYLLIWFCRPQTGTKQSFGRSITKHKVPPKAKQPLIVEAVIGYVSIIVVLGVVGGGVASLGKGLEGELGRGSLLLVGALVSGAVSLTLTFTIGTRVRSVLADSDGKA